MLKDLLIGCIKDYDWPTIRPYAISLSRLALQSTQALCVCNVSQEARDNLLALGFLLIDFQHEQRPRGPYIDSDFVIRARFIPVLEFMEKNQGKFRYTLWSDVRDVVFQSNPFAWLEDHLSPARLAATGEGFLIKDSPEYNDKWIRDTVPRDYARLRHHEVCCGGLLAGEFDAVYAVLGEVYRLVCGSPIANDQGALNYVLRVSPFCDMLRIPGPEEGFTATWYDGKQHICNILPNYPLPRFDRNTGLVYVPNTDIPFAIVHQYDRSADWRPIIAEKYK